MWVEHDRERSAGVRLALEPVIAAIAASKATTASLEKIENCARRTAEVTDDESWSRWDGAFHRAIAEATRNGVFEALIVAFNTARTQPQWRSLRRAVTPEMRRVTVGWHRAIANALRQRQAEQAGRAMRAHLLAVRDHLSVVPEVHAADPHAASPVDSS